MIQGVPPIRPANGGEWGRMGANENFPQIRHGGEWGRMGANENLDFGENFGKILAGFAVANRGERGRMGVIKKFILRIFLRYIIMYIVSENYYFLHPKTTFRTP